MLTLKVKVDSSSYKHLQKTVFRGGRHLHNSFIIIFTHKLKNVNAEENRATQVKIQNTAEKLVRIPETL